MSEVAAPGSEISNHFLKEIINLLYQKGFGPITELILKTT